jgi:hypothetical protein
VLWVGRVKNNGYKSNQDDGCLWGDVLQIVARMNGQMILNTLLLQITSS